MPAIAARHAAPLAAAAALALALAGCGGGSPGRDKVGVYKVGRPYQINGRWYYPEYDAGYERVGVASWYGDAFDGLDTANGEVFDKDAISAAHPTLPLPSVVRVTNLQNGRSLDVRVNDRGPFVDDRVIDLSQAAARRLGFEQAGLAQVRVKFVGLADDARGVPPVPDAAPPSPPVMVARAEPAPPPVHAPPRPTPSQQPRRAPDAAAPPVFDEPILQAPTATAPPPPRVVARELPPLAAPPSQRARASLSPRPPVLADAAPAATVVPPRPAPPPVPPAYCGPGPYYVVVGSFGDSVRVRAATAAVAGLPHRVTVAPSFAGGHAVARVRLGPVSGRGVAAATLDRVRALGYPEASLIPATPGPAPAGTTRC
jgi:rare lipoprotein A